MDWSPRRLQQWLSERFNGEGELLITPIEHAISNENYSVDWGHRQWLLRKMPAVLSHQSAHNVLREYNILKALQKTPVRIPNTVVVCDDRSIIGTPFFIMERIDGVVIDRLLPPTYGISNDCVDVLAIEMLNTIVALHKIDWRRSNLSNIGKTSVNLEQQVRRWHAQHQMQSRGAFSLITQVTSWLLDNCPVGQGLVVIHGDFQLGNMIISRQPPARLLAVIDWELATLGDPLIDLASVLLSWPTRGNNYANKLLAGGKSQVGTANLGQLARQYAKATGRDVSLLNYYFVLAAWKRAIVLESRYENHQRNSALNNRRLQKLELVKSNIVLLLKQANHYIFHPVSF